MSHEENLAIVRQKTLDYIPAVGSLQRRVYPEKLAWSKEELEQHLRVFPEGQLVAVDQSGSVVGSCVPPQLLYHSLC